MRSTASPFRRSLACLAAVTTGLAACAIDAPTASDVRGATFARTTGSAVQRPFSGHCETTFNPPPFPLPAVHRQIDVGTCQLAHLGRAALHGVQDISFATGTQSGERTFTAANGDELRAVHSGTSRPGQPGQVEFSATLTFVGGTGRFANATGEVRASGTATLATRSASATFDGWIAYDASDRRRR